MQIKHFVGIIASSLVLGVAGCASIAVKDSHLEDRTSSALGLDKSQFTISDRVNKGVRTDYVVKTTAGKTYRCYVTGTVSAVGRSVSDAICSQHTGSYGSAINTKKRKKSCNALLKAAGRC